MNINVREASIDYIYKCLDKFFAETILYPNFPEIPSHLRDDRGRLREGYSVYKKGLSYFLVDDDRSEYVETLEDISGLDIVFHFTETELESPHYGEIVCTNISDIMDESEETQYYAQILEKAMDNDDYSNYDTEVSEKLWYLYCYYKDSMFNFLERISLEKVGEHFIVIHTDISFTGQQLEEIKKRNS